MTARRPDESDEGSTGSRILETILSIVGATSELVQRLSGSLDASVHQHQVRLMRSAAALAILFAGGVFLVLGLFFFLIDHAHAPRAVVFSVGGLVILLVAIILHQANRK